MDRGRSSPVARLATIAALVLPIVLPMRALAVAGDTIADRVLGQVDFGHATAPSFIRKKSLDLHGDPRGNGIAIDRAHVPSAIYVADRTTNRVLAWHDVSSFADGADADLVIGAPDFYTGSQGCQRTATGLCFPVALAVDPSGDLFVSGDHVERFAAPFAQSPPVSGTAFVSDLSLDPWGVAADSQGNVYVALRNPSQVVEYDAGTTTPHLLFGQATFGDTACNRGGTPSAITLCNPYAVAVDAANNLYVADSSNHRVLVFNTPLDSSSGEPGAGDTTADLVIGQAGFATGAPATDSLGLNKPRGLAVDLHGNLYVGDTGNNRVTEYDAPLATHEPATLVVGQPDATSNGCNQNGVVGAGTLCNPSGVATDSSGNLYVYDADNDRVVAYTENNPPRTATGGRVLGQHDLAHATTNFVDATTVNATAIAVDRHSTPNHLYTVDILSNRVLGYEDAATFSNGGAADLVLGQPDFFSNLPNGGGSANAHVLSMSEFGNAGAAVDSQGNLWVSDPGNRRAVGFAAPFASGMAANEAATKVLGEPDLTAVAGGIGCGGTQTSTCAPNGIALDAADNLYLVDSDSVRVLEFDAPWAFGGTLPQPASLVFGQGSSGTSFAGTGCNQGGVGPDSVCNPFGVALDAHDNLYVADAGNNRILEYRKPVPFGGGTPGTVGSAGDVTADLVFGQGGAFGAATCNSGARSAASLCTPTFVAVDPFGSLFVSDFGNNRVLAYAESDPPSNDTATLEFGQSTTGDDFTDGAANAGGLTAYSLAIGQFNRPPGVALDSTGSLYVADAGNTRLLAYDGPFPNALPPSSTTTTTTTSTTTTTTTVVIPSTTSTTIVPTTTTSSSSTSTSSSTSSSTSKPSTSSTTKPVSTTTATPSTTTSTGVTTTTLGTVLLPSACPNAAAAAAVEAAIEAQCHCREAANHGAFVRCATQVAKQAVKAGTLTARCKHAVTTCAKHSVCGKPGFVTCCRTTTKGKTACSTKSSAALCRPAKHGSACVGERPSCCDACATGGCAAGLVAPVEVP